MTEKKLSNPLNLTTNRHGSNGDQFAKLTFQDCIFQESVEIGHLSFAGYITFRGCIFQGQCAFQSSANVNFEGDNVFEKDFHLFIDQDSVLSNITLKGVATVFVHNSRLALKGINKKDSFPDSQIILHGNARMLECMNVKLSVIDCLNLRVEGLANFISCKFADFRMNNNPGAYLQLHVSFFVISEMNLALSCTNSAIFVNGIFLKIGIGGKVDKDGSYLFSLIEARDWSFNNVINKGNIKLHQVRMRQGGSLAIYDSDLGASDFILCDFKSGRFYLRNNKLAGIFLAETDFPEWGPETGPLVQAQLAFGQIATAFQKQGDNVRAIEYQAREIECHYNRLELMPKG